MTLGSLDSNEIGRYEETTSLNTTWSSLLNLALESISAAFTKYVRKQTIRKRTSGNLASSSSYQALAMNTAVIGSDFTHSAGVLTCAVAGEYRVSLSISFAANSAGSRSARLAGSGSLGTRSLNLLGTGLSASLDTTVAVDGLFTCAVGDTITMQALQNSGSSLAVVGHVLIERIV